MIRGHLVSISLLSGLLKNELPYYCILQKRQRAIRGCSDWFHFRQVLRRITLQKNYTCGNYQITNEVDRDITNVKLSSKNHMKGDAPNGRKILESQKEAALVAFNFTCAFLRDGLNYNNVFLL